MDIELVGIAEIAERLGVSKQRIGNLIDSKKANFPEPLARLRMGPVWIVASTMERVSNDCHQS